MSGQRFGVAVLGTGIMGRRMLASLVDHPRFDAVAAYDPDPVALMPAVAVTPGMRAATGIDDLVRDPSVDLVYIASPPSRHRDGVDAALAAGRACLCEKPLAADVDDAERLRRRVDAAGSPFAVNFPFASAPSSRRLVELVRDGHLGTIAQASLTVRFARWPRAWQAGANAWLSGAAEGGFTREVLSHFVFLAQRLFGEATVTDVEVVRDAGQAETALRAKLVHATVTVNIDAAVAGDIADANRFEIVGSTGIAALTNWTQLDYGGETSARVDATPHTLDRVAAMLDGRSDHGLATAAEGLRVVRCIESMQRNSR